MKRRHFLQAAGTTLTTIGLSQLDFLVKADRTHQVLAQPGSRKLALLVGINAYTGGINPLNGCLSDVEMQYELLRYRYGFNPSDILLLSDDTSKKPTRTNILTAFEEHLIKQAKPGDTVIFHYSGHGALVIDNEPIPEFMVGGKGFNGTLIPMDTSYNNRNDIMGKTLFLLSSQVNTENFTMILDSCHSGGGTRGKHTVRALTRRNKSEPDAQPSTEEIKYQDQQLSKLGWDRKKLLQLRTKGIAKGIAIGSAKPNQLAVDASFEGFSAGALTYLLTRYLWQLPGQEDLITTPKETKTLPEDITTTFNRLALITQEIAAASGNPQQPVKQEAPGSPLAAAPVYNLAATSPCAEGVIRKIDPSNQKEPIEFWLGGVSETSLKGFAPGSLFTMIDKKGTAIGEIEQTSRAGLVGYGKLKSGIAPTPGTLLREKLRNLPSEITLTIGLDDSLGSDRDALATALKGIPQVAVVPVNQRGPVNFIVGRLTDEARKSGKVRGTTISQPNNSIGLFTAGYEPIDSNLFGRLGESAESVAARLRPKFKMFLAREYLTRMINGNASQLNVDVSFKAIATGNTQVLSKGGTRSIISAAPEAYKIDRNNPPRLDIVLTNQEKNAIYMSAIQIGTDGVMTILHPSNWSAPESSAVINPGDTKNIELEITPPAGFFEVLVITSASPLRDTLKGLQTIARGRGLDNSYLSFDGSNRSVDDSEDSIVGLSRNLVEDLTRGLSPAGVTKSRGLNPQQSAVFSSIIQVVE
jgi:hypothetical protein